MNRYASSANVDVMKWSRSLMMLARAVDFYLDLENAYDYYDVLAKSCCELT